MKVANSDTSQEKKWQAESDLSTLVEAERIKMDSGRMKAAMALRKERMAALSNIEGEKKGK